jgi:hypothetical protein
MLYEITTLKETSMDALIAQLTFVIGNINQKSNLPVTQKQKDALTQQAAQLSALIEKLKVPVAEEKK